MGIIILLAVVSTITVGLSTRELLRRFPPQPSRTLVESAVLPDWPGLLSPVLPRTLRRFWNGLVFVLSSATCLGLHVIMILVSGDSGTRNTSR